MKERALELIRDIADPSDKLNVLREYAQTMALRSLHESEAFTNLSFVGGTALRFLYNLPRFSEDLDFSLENTSGYEPERWLKKIKNDFRFAGFDTAVTWNNKSTVHKSWIKLRGLLKEAGLAAMSDQNLSIKLEIDSKPPAGAVSETSLINRHAMLSLRYYNLPSLMAGKVHALITRKYAKGRDWYDLIWYRARRPPVDPNLELLQNSLNQTMRTDALNAKNWKSNLSEKLELMDCQALIRDVSSFLEHPGDSALLTRESIRSVLI